MGGADAAVESFYGFLLEWPSLYRAALAWHQVKPARLALEIIRLRKAKDQVGQAPIARLAPEIFENIYEQLLAMHIQEQPLELKDLLHQQEAEDNQSEDNQSSNGSPYIGVLNGKSMTKLKTFAKDHGCRLFGPSEFEQEQGYGDTSATGHVQGFGMGVKIGVGWLGSMPEGAYEVSRVARPLAHAYLKGPSLATMFKNFQLKEEKVSSGESGWDPEDDEFENDYQEGLPHVLFVMTGDPY